MFYVPVSGLRRCYMRILREDLHRWRVKFENRRDSDVSGGDDAGALLNLLAGMWNLKDCKSASRMGKTTHTWQKENKNLSRKIQNTFIIFTLINWCGV